MGEPSILRGLVGSCLVITLLAVPLASASHPATAPLTFQLSSTSASPAGALVAYRDSGPGSHFVPGTEPTPVGVLLKSCLLWVSDEQAQLALDLPAQTGTYSVRFGIISGVESITFELGKRKPGGGYVATTPASRDTIELFGASTPQQDVDVAGTIAYAGQHVEAGERIALRICVTFLMGTTAGEAAVRTAGGVSSFALQSSPPPPWPAPELGTVLLVGVGLAGLGLVALGRRKR